MESQNNPCFILALCLRKLPDQGMRRWNVNRRNTLSGPTELRMQRWKFWAVKKGWSQKEQLGKVLLTRKTLESSMGNSIHPWSGLRAYTCKARLVRPSREGLLCRHDQKEYIRSQATVQNVLTMFYDALSRAARYTLVLQMVTLSLLFKSYCYLHLSVFLFLFPEPLSLYQNVCQGSLGPLSK